MSSEKPPQGSRLVWCLRSYAWVVMACVLALAAAPLIVMPSAPVFQADALIFARQLSVSRQVLPRLGEAVFANGAVTDAVAADPAVQGNIEGLIPERLSVVAAEDSIVLDVQARDPDPATAARLANTAAAAFVEELNSGGAGVGEFALQGEAIVPSEPLSTLPPHLRSAIGALAGLILGLGVVALVATIRRPVVTAHDVADVTGVPLLGTVQLPLVTQNSYPGPLGVPGIATVTRWLATLPSGRLLLISTSSAVAIRQRIYVMCGVALWTLRPLRFEAAPELTDAIRTHCRHHRSAGRTVHGGMDVEDEIVLVDGGSILELVDPVVANVSIVAVAPLGIGRKRLRALTADFVGNGLVGVILVDVRQGFQGAVGRGERPLAARVPDAAPEQEEENATEPKRA